MDQKQTLVLMPGLDGTGKLFAPIIPLLKPQFNLVFVTYPDLNSFADYIDCARSQLPDEPGFSLLAESFSGPVAMALLAQHPEPVGPSVIASSFVRSPLATLTRMASYIPEQMFSIGALSDFCLDVHTSDDEDFSETQPLPLNVTEQIDGTALKHRISVFSRIDVSALLPEINVPILYLHALRDRITSDHDAQMMENHLPDVNRVDIDGPHLLLQNQPLLCSELIIKHIQSRNET